MKARLKSAHYFPNDKLLMGDVENTDRGEASGTVVGDGTEYPLCTYSAQREGAMCFTVEMEPLDDEARDALEEEEERLAKNGSGMDPTESLALTLSAMQSMDGFEKNYVPGFNVKRPEAKK